MDKIKVYVSLLFTLMLIGCAVKTVRPVEDIELPQFDSPEQAQVFERQCRPLITEPLQALLEQLDQENLQLLAAWERFEQAQAQAQRAQSAFWPSLQLSAEASRGETPLLDIPAGNGGTTTDQPNPLAPGTGEPDIENQYRVSAAASYELDLWGRLNSAADAAQYTATAARGDARAMAMSLNAQLLETWYDWGFTDARNDLLREQVAISEQLLELLKLRYLNGQTSALDAMQQEQQVQSLESALLQNRQQASVIEHQLAVLLGQQPQLFAEAEKDMLEKPPQLPILPDASPNTDFSAALLANRPDLQSAFYQLNAADAELAQAVAQRLPSIRLSASVFDQSQTTENLGGNLFWQIAASLTQPLFTGGRIEAQIDAAQAAADQSIYRYQQTLLTSLQELANAWTSQQHTASRIDSLQRQRQLAQESFALVSEQYRRGAVDFLRVLDALQTMIDVQQSLLEARRQYLSYRVQFCRALGDDWLPTSHPESNQQAET